jgi:hypothetical protein
MAPLEKARRCFGGGDADKKKGQTKQLCKEKRWVSDCKEGDTRDIGHQASAINLHLIIRYPPPPRKPQKLSHCSYLPQQKPPLHPFTFLST